MAGCEHFVPCENPLTSTTKPYSICDAVVDSENRAVKAGRGIVLLALLRLYGKEVESSTRPVWLKGVERDHKAAISFMMIIPENYILLRPLIWLWHLVR